MKIVTIIGARPQFIKAAVVSRVFSVSSEVEEVIVHTGQHFDANMSDVFFEEMCIPRPHYNLNINGLGHGAMTGQMLEKIEEVLLKEKPEWVTLIRRLPGRWQQKSCISRWRMWKPGFVRSIWICQRRLIAY